MREVIMLKFGQTMEQGSVSKWLKQEGDWVSAGDALVEVETDKSTMEICSEVSGVLKQIIVPEGKTVPVLTLLAYVGEEQDEAVAGSHKLKPTHVRKPRSMGWENGDRSDTQRIRREKAQMDLQSDGSDSRV